MVCGQRELSKGTPIGVEVVVGIVSVCSWFRITKEAIRYLSDLRRSTLRHAGSTPPPSYLNTLSRKGASCIYKNKINRN